jgi:hypothetical protein
VILDRRVLDLAALLPANIEKRVSEKMVHVSQNWLHSEIEEYKVEWRDMNRWLGRHTEIEE